MFIIILCLLLTFIIAVVISTYFNPEITKFLKEHGLSKLMTGIELDVVIHNVTDDVSTNTIITNAMGIGNTQPDLIFLYDNVFNSKYVSADMPYETHINGYDIYSVKIENDTDNKLPTEMSICINRSLLKVKKMSSDILWFHLPIGDYTYYMPVLISKNRFNDKTLFIISSKYIGVDVSKHIGNAEETDRKYLSSFLRKIQNQFMDKNNYLILNITAKHIQLGDLYDACDTSLLKTTSELSVHVKKHINLFAIDRRLINASIVKGIHSSIYHEKYLFINAPIVNTTTPAVDAYIPIAADEIGVLTNEYKTTAPMYDRHSDLDDFYGVQSPFNPHSVYSPYFVPSAPTHSIISEPNYKHIYPKLDDDVELIINESPPPFQKQISNETIVSAPSHLEDELNALYTPRESNIEKFEILEGSITLKDTEKILTDDKGTRHHNISK